MLHPSLSLSLYKQISINVSIVTHTSFFQFKAKPWLRWLVPGLSTWRPGCDLRPFHVGFMMEKVALG
jgi:hypothetical protein